MISPFKGFTYSKKAGHLTHLIAPPYDVITPEYRKELLNHSPYNIVNLTLPESFTSEYYDEVKRKIDQWCKENIIIQDESEGYYVVVQKFSFDGKCLERIGFIGLFDLRKEDKIIRHEITFGKYIDDRMKLLETTKSNLEPIFLVFEDRQNLLAEISQNLDFQEEFDFEDHSIKFLKCQPQHLSGLIDKIKNSHLFIADGHHRFQASLEFFRQKPDAPQYIMVYLTNLFSDGLVVLPTHRAVKFLLTGHIMSKIKKFFEVENKGNLEQTMNSIKNTEKISFGVYFDNRYQTWTLTNNEKIINFLPGNHSKQWKFLNVVILHHFLFEKILKIPAEKKLYYERNPEYIVEYVNQNPGNIGFFMQPPDLMKIREVSLNREILPPKTTFFYPKIPSGLVIARYV